MSDLSAKPRRSLALAAMIIVLACAWGGLRVLRVAAGPSNARAGADATTDRPNIVLYVVDTLRADRVGAYGYAGGNTTPTIDRLATESVLFEQAYAAAPWTLPSMASLMLSRFACEHGALSTRTHLPRSVPTLAERLKKLGYSTVALYANAMVAPEFGFDRGFDVYQESAINAAEQVDAVLQHAGRGPFFLYVHNIGPHNPEQVAPPHTPGLPDVPPHVRRELHEHYRAYRSATRVDFTAGRPVGQADTTADQDRHLAYFRQHLAVWSDLYDAAVLQEDQRLASVIALLKARGLWGSTLFVFVSDHGEEFFEHGGWTHAQAVYDEQVRVPLIIKFPEGRFGGRRVRKPVSLVDLMPTLAAWLGRNELADGAVGINLLPHVGETRFLSKPLPPRVVSMRENVMNDYRPFRRQRGNLNVVVRLGPWKAIWNAEPARLELYALDSDPAELHDIAAAQPAIARELAAAAQRFLSDCRSSAAAGQAVDQLDDRTLKALRSLGYAD